jgi:hypothetical protein
MKPTLIRIFLILSLASTACNLPLAVTPTATPTLFRWTPTPKPSATPKLTLTLTPLPTETATLTLPPSETLTPEPSATPTYAFPEVTVHQQAHCRYGPAKAHLHAADLYPGDKGTVRGRFQYSKWLYIKFDKLNYFCWVAPSVVDVTGDISLIQYAEVKLPGPSVLYKPPRNVQATRNGKEVLIQWDMVNMTDDDDRGYFLELFVCQDGNLLWWTAALEEDTMTQYEVRDEPGCSAPSEGKLYAVEKHGYTTPVIIPWPKP